jgi:hypothetical protein
MAEMIQRGSFAGHETFPFRYTWMRKAIQFVREDPTGFTRDDAMVELGVGKNMVRSMRHWALVAGVLEEDPSVHNNRGSHLRATPFGRKLLADGGWDPFLEDPATAWLLHWQIASTPDQATTWFWVFNLLPQPEFSRPDLHRWLMQVVETGGWQRISPESLKRDLDCFLRCYVPAKASRGGSAEDGLDCPWIELGLLRERGERGTYVLNRADHPSLPDEIVAHALIEHVHRLGSTNVKTIPLDQIAFASGSPGRVFCLTEDALLVRLERLSAITDGAMSFDDTAGLRQILVRELPEKGELLATYYSDRKRSQKA